MRELEPALPELASNLAQLRARLFDLYPVIKTHIYDPAFHGSFSIKAVLPALVPHLDYDDLEIGDGLLASLVYEDCATPTRRPIVPPSCAPISSPTAAVIRKRCWSCFGR